MERALSRSATGRSRRNPGSVDKTNAGGICPDADGDFVKVQPDGGEIGSVEISRGRELDGLCRP